ncbi:cytochrome b [Paenirhodobacter sp.]|uniref:cytochrome b n=1 Tax=Paenirhodobacter sp. TaxID=1965326 RepID=UPI003B3E17E5
MQIADTETKYGLITRLLHWSVAGLILWQFLGMGLRLMLGRHPVAGFFVGTHQWIGALLFVLIVARVLWALINMGNRPPHEGLLGLAAKAGHALLYVLMVAVPALGLLRAWGGTRGFAPLGIPIFAPRAEGEEIGWAVNAANLLHGELAWLLGAVVLGHVAMVGVHEGLWRDGTLRRMLGRPRR